MPMPVCVDYRFVVVVVVVEVEGMARGTAIPNFERFETLG